MQHSLAHGEQFTRMKIRVSTSEFKQLHQVGILYWQPAVYRRTLTESVCLQYRCLMMGVAGKREAVSRLTGGWYEVELERTALLSKDENHQWLKWCLQCIQEALTPNVVEPIPEEFRQWFIDPADVVYRRKRIKVRGWGRNAVARCLITKAHQILAELQDRVEYPAMVAPPELPVASEQSINKLVQFYQEQHA